MPFRAQFLVALISLGTVPFAVAQDVGQHPAVFAPRCLPGVNPDTFIVGHPASPRNRAGHANSEHPAVTQWLQSATPTIDGNRFLVQPPASVQWTPAPLIGPGTAAALAAVAPPARPPSN